MQSTDPKQEQDPMTTATMTAAPQTSIANHTRLVSFENSNSFLKRHDTEGSLVIQAGYKLNPNRNAHSDDQNPIVILGNEKRWYGSIACQGDHVRSFERSKVETQREAFSACLRPSDHGRDLIVVAAHWDSNEFGAIAKSLTGPYNVTRNGHQIRCNVTQVIPVLEGLGSYESVKSRLSPGSSLLFEVGFATGEEWLLDEHGRIIDGRPSSKLGILNLVTAIANDPSVKAALGHGDSAETMNLCLISAALQSDRLGRMSEGNWSAIRTKYAKEYLKNLSGYIKGQYSNELQSVTNVILTGGGAALLNSLFPAINEHFTIPSDPQTASVRGSFEAQLAKV
jgi:hypothetical protein